MQFANSARRMWLKASRRESAMSLFSFMRMPMVFGIVTEPFDLGEGLVHPIHLKQFGGELETRFEFLTRGGMVGERGLEELNAAQVLESIFEGIALVHQRFEQACHFARAGSAVVGRRGWGLRLGEAIACEERAGQQEPEESCQELGRKHSESRMAREMECRGAGGRWHQVRDVGWVLRPCTRWVRGVFGRRKRVVEGTDCRGGMRLGGGPRILGTVAAPRESAANFVAASRESAANLRGCALGRGAWWKGIVRHSDEMPLQGRDCSGVS
jgi:hypothetical protein